MGKKWGEDIEDVDYQEIGYFSYGSGKQAGTPNSRTVVSKVGPLTIHVYGPASTSWISTGSEGYVDAIDPFSEWEEHLRDVMPKNWHGHSSLVESEAQFQLVRAKIYKLLVEGDREPESRDTPPVLVPRTRERDRSVHELSEDVRPQLEAPRPVLAPETDSDPVSRFQRWCWLLLTVASLSWGVVTGAAFWRTGFPVSPAYALLVALLLIGLVLTLFQLGRRT
jgi:hypothetical protein